MNSCVLSFHFQDFLIDAERPEKFIIQICSLEKNHKIYMNLIFILIRPKMNNTEVLLGNEAGAKSLAWLRPRL